MLPWTCGGMITSMTTTKIAVSVPREILQRAQRAVKRGRADSMSAYVAAALAQKTTLDELDDLLVKMLAESGGPLTAGEAAMADLALTGPSRRNRRRSRRKRAP